MRTPSAHQVKYLHDDNQAVPRQGTYPRFVYDLLKANKGRVVEVPAYYDLMGEMKSDTRSKTINYLMDFYGCDIRMVRKCHYVLAGEWIDKKYVDYMEKVK